MKKNEVAKKITNQLSELMLNEGFTYSRKEESFIKSKDECVCIFQVQLIDMTEIGTGRKLFLVEPYIFIHHKGIESVFLNHYHIKYEDNYLSYTIGGSIFVLAHPLNEKFCQVSNGSLNYIISDIQELNLIVQQLFRIYNEFAKKYFNKYCDIKEISHALNDYPDKTSTHNKMGPIRRMKGIIAERLSKGQNFDSLSKFYLEKMHSCSKEDFDSFMRISEMLASDF